jgi:D-alanine-D-alanine ligase-like ATP-grasp enzyme
MGRDSAHGQSPRPRRASRGQGGLTVAPASRLLSGLARLGRPGRILSPELDALRTNGLRGGFRARRASATDRDERLATGHLAAYRRIWDDAATAVGAQLSELGGGFLLASRDGVQSVLRHHLVMLNDPATNALALNKAIVHELLVDAQIPVPEYLEAGRGELPRALSFMQRSTGPCVVKPANGTSGGTGVTCGVQSDDDLWRAWLRAGRWDRRVLIERQTPGEEYRLLFLEGNLLDAVRRRRPCVVGDGSASVTELIELENQRRLSALDRDVSRLINVDLDCELAVRGEGLSLRSIPARGARIAVKNTVSENAAAENTTAPELSAELIGQAARAVELLHLEFAGVDLVTPDPARSLTDAGGTILEINATPGLHYHYQVADGERATDVAAPILERLLSSPRR